MPYSLLLLTPSQQELMPVLSQIARVESYNKHARDSARAVNSRLSFSGISGISGIARARPELRGPSPQSRHGCTRRVRRMSQVLHSGAPVEALLIANPQGIGLKEFQELVRPTDPTKARPLR